LAVIFSTHPEVLATVALAVLTVVDVKVLIPNAQVTKLWSYWDSAWRVIARL
jgi:hypothetical protein